MNNTTPSLIEWITAIGAVSTPILLSIFTAVGWLIQRRIERSQKAEEALRERARKLEEELRGDRIKVYNDVLEPFIILLTKDEGFLNDKNYKGKTKMQVFTEKVISVSYKQTAFKLSLFASDNVVRSYNDMMQFFYNHASQQTNGANSEPRESDIHLFTLLGGLLLEIRKSVGNEDTKLDTFAMLEWLITDTRQIK